MVVLVIIQCKLTISADATIEKVKNGLATPFLQIREGMGPNRVIKPKAKKKRKGDARQCQTGMCIMITITDYIPKFYSKPNIKNFL